MKNIFYKKEEEPRMENFKNEKCAYCGKDTGVLKSTPVGLREFFIEGCGQLCEACYYSINNDFKLGEPRISNDEMEILLNETNLVIKGEGK